MGRLLMTGQWFGNSLQERGIGIFQMPHGGRNEKKCAERIHSNRHRKIQGDADVLLFPDIHAGNMVYKAIVHMVNMRSGGILTGTKVPVILTSRSDSFETKVNSIALAAVVSEELQKKAYTA